MSSAVITSEPSRPIRVVHAVDALARSLGGPSESVTALCHALGRAGHLVTVFAVDCQATLGEPVPVDETLARCLAFPPVVPGPPGRVAPAPKALIDALAAAARESDLLHSHTMWGPLGRLAPRLARTAGRPYLVSLRGMLDPVSFGQKIWKKRLGMLAFGYRNIRKAACLHATAPKELESIRQFTSTRPVAVIPNPIEVPPDSGLDYQEARTWVAALAPPVRDKRLALCLSRLHPQKRVDLLLSAWAALGDLRRDWHLVVAGPDQLGYTKRMRALVSDLGLAGEVSFPGPIYDQSKWRLYRAAELFILPSPSENFGMVVAEALAAGAPAVATTGTPWSWLRESDCGWHVAPTAEALHDAIAQAISLNAHQREAMGQRGRHLILRRFSGEAVARSMSAVYGWLLGRCEMPGCVDGG